MNGLSNATFPAIIDDFVSGNVMKIVVRGIWHNMHVVGIDAVKGYDLFFSRAGAGYDPRCPR